MTVPQTKTMRNPIRKPRKRRVGCRASFSASKRLTVHKLRFTRHAMHVRDMRWSKCTCRVMPGFGHAQARGLFGGHSLRHGETSVARNQLEEHADGRDRSSGQTTWYGQLCVATRHRGQFPISANSASRLLTENISQAQRNRPGQLHPC